METKLHIRHETENQAIEAASKIQAYLTSVGENRIFFISEDTTVPTHPHVVLSVEN